MPWRHFRGTVATPTTIRVVARNTSNVDDVAPPPCLHALREERRGDDQLVTFVVIIRTMSDVTFSSTLFLPRARPALLTSMSTFRNCSGKQLVHPFDFFDVHHV